MSGKSKSWKVRRRKSQKKFSGISQKQLTSTTNVVEYHYICRKETAMKLTDTEWQIMNCLWERYPATARGIAERLPKEINWAYTTIKTLLTRLAEKGAVKESKKGNTSLYEPIVSRQTARRSALASLANQAFDGAFGPLMHFLVEEKKISANERKEIVKMLEKGLATEKENTNLSHREHRGHREK